MIHGLTRISHPTHPVARVPSSFLWSFSLFSSYSWKELYRPVRIAKLNTRAMCVSKFPLEMYNNCR